MAAGRPPVCLFALAYRTLEDLIDKAAALAAGMRRGKALAAERLGENIQKALR